MAEAQGWYSSEWPYRKAITFDCAQVSGTFSNFPVLTARMQQAVGSSQTATMSTIFSSALKSDGFLV